LRLHRKCVAGRSMTIGGSRPKADIQTIEFGSLMRSFVIAYLPAQLAPDHRSKKVAKLAGYENRSLCVCDMSGDTKLDLRTSISLTPNMQVTPKSSRRARAFREVPSGRAADYLRGSEDPHLFRHRARG
jgi:hypothetical protein